MATFLSSYQSRLSDQLRTNWSNGQDSAAVVPDVALETLADSDVCGEFKKRGIVPDSTDDRHVTTAIGGIIGRLMFYTQNPGWAEAWDTFKEDVKLLAESTSRDRIIPYTNSLLNPSVDVMGDLPSFDPANMTDYIPNAPNPNTSND